MKKIISLVLALVMVAAIAVSASAITGTVVPASTSAAKGPYYDISIKLITGEGALASGLGLLSLTDVSSTQAYILDSTVYFALSYKSRATNDIKMNATDYKEPAILISSDTVKFVGSAFALYAITGGGTSISTVNLSVVSSFSAAYAAGEVKQDGSTGKRWYINIPSGTEADYLLMGSGVVKTAAAGTVQADFMGNRECLKFYSVTDGDDISDALGKAFTASTTHTGSLVTPGHTIYNSSGNALYTVVGVATATSSGNDSYTITIVEDGHTYKGYSVEFICSRGDTKGGSEKNVKDIKVTIPTGKTAEGTYTVADVGTIISSDSTSLKFISSGGTTLYSGDTGYSALRAVYTQVMDFFGLSYSVSGILLPTHFASKFSDFYAMVNVKVPYYGSSITDPDISIPPTGDASSIGFVMIALAIVAASALAYRKVRS